LFSVYYDCARPGASAERTTTVPSKVVSETTLTGLTDQEPLTLAVSDFLTSVRLGHAPLSDGEFSLRVLEVLEAGEKSLRSGGISITI
jgi:hypothetical protein